MTQTVRTLQVKFPNMPLRNGEIRYLRSILNDIIGWQDPLLHNHTPDGGDIYRYPLVHYRTYKGHAMLFGLEQGCEAIGKLVSTYMTELPPEMATMQMESQQTAIEMTTQRKLYYVHHFLPFNTENFEEWINTKGLIHRIRRLEQIIEGNILDVCKTVGFRIPDKSLKVEIEILEDIGFIPFPAKTGEIKMKAFNISYYANILLPNQIAIGKGKSKGYGVQREIMK